MRRYLFVALAIAALSILATSVLYEFGVLSRFSEKLAVYYANLGLIARDVTPNRMLHYLAFIVVGFSSAWSFLDIPKAMHKWIIIIGSMLVVMGFSATLLTLGIFFEPFSSLFTIFTAAGLAWAYSFTEPGSRKSVLHYYLGDRISHESLSLLLEEESPGFLKGRNYPVTVLSLRLFNQAALRSALQPAELVEMTALFLRNSGEFLATRGAYLDESSPDSVRAYFGLTREGDQHPEQACLVAKELEERLTNLNQELETRFFHRMKYGIALASGEVTVGAYRSSHATKLNAIGNLADYAYRLSGANAAYGSRILVSADTYSLIRERYAVRPMELMYDASTELMAEAYELIDLKGQLTEEEEESREQFWQGVIFYREGRAEEALRIFSELQAGRPKDGPLSYFIDRAQSLLLGETDPQGAGSLLVNGHARVLQSV